MFNRISIKWKIFGFLLGFCALLLIFLWLFQVVLLDRFYQTIKTNQLKRAAAEVVRNIDNPNLTAIVQRTGVSFDACMEVLSQRGVTSVDAHVVPDCIIHLLPLSEKMQLFYAAVQNGGMVLEYFPKGTFYMSNDGAFGITGGLSDSLVLAQTVTSQAGDLYLVLANNVVTPVDATVSTLRTQLYFVTAFMIVFSVAIALILSRRISKPIETINRSAKVLAKGDYEGADFSASGYREISELSATLSYARDELSKTDALQKELIANVSHDLRTPLTLISGYAEMMRDYPEEISGENAGVIVDETRRIARLVDDMLNLSKLQAGAMTLEKERYSLTESLKSVVDTTAELVKKEGYTLIFDAPEEVYVNADEPKISAAFYNLLTNAVNYTGEDKTVTVRQIVKGDTVRVEVSDTGEGIEQENLPFIWQRYYRLGNKETHRRAVAGTGLGLSIVRSVIELHGGQCGAVSQMGEGSTFWFELRIDNG